ncbi:lipase family protein [Gordonia sp. CPCC 205515]|uniref:lipase family protein n=1 Tax=Gordonia sp. CPCC 205515 TaxID=3140791 RepID=UPI003AF3D5A6
MTFRRILTGAVIAIVLTAALAAAAGIAHAGPVPDPRNDPFYAQPTSFAGRAHGQILNSRPVDIGIAGIELPYAAYQLKYVSTDTAGAPQANVATVLKPLSRTSSPKLVSYQPVIDSLSHRCDPSYQLRTGSNLEVPFIAILLNRGWTVVIPDYLGPDHHWGAGYVEGHGTLDGIRAAEEFTPAGLGGPATPVALTGYSGGAHGTEAAYELAPTYAPELNIVGAALGGLPADMGDLMHGANGGLWSGAVFTSLFGLDRAYPTMGIDEMLNAKGRQLRNAISDMCVFEYLAAYPFQYVQSYTINSVNPLDVPAVKSVLAKTKAGALGTPRAPGYYYNASGDELVVPANVDKLVARYCARGLKVQSVTEPGIHATLAVTGYPAAVNWIAGRFARTPAPSTC